MQLDIGNHCCFVLNVFRDRQHDRAGPARPRSMKRARYEFGNTSRVVDLGRPFRSPAEHALDVHFLERFAPDKGGVELGPRT